MKRPRFASSNSHEIISGLLHVRRFINGLYHDDDCPAFEGRKVMCECGKSLSIEQIDAATKKLRSANGVGA